MRKPAKLSYVGHAYRYDMPQPGRYREFTQFGVEILGNTPGDGQSTIS
jgi:histidyl-tRNA synthetase